MMTKININLNSIPDFIFENYIEVDDLESSEDFPPFLIEASKGLQFFGITYSDKTKTISIKKRLDFEKLYVLLYAYLDLVIAESEGVVNVLTAPPNTLNPKVVKALKNKKAVEYYKYSSSIDNDEDTMIGSNGGYVIMILEVLEHYIDHFPNSL